MYSRSSGFVGIIHGSFFFWIFGELEIWTGTGSTGRELVLFFIVVFVVVDTK